MNETHNPSEKSIPAPDSEKIPFLALGKPDPGIPFTNGPCGVYGRYTSDGKITFEGRCVTPWEFMATGSGVSGLTVAAGRELAGQINHSAALDEQGTLRSLGRFQLDWDYYAAVRMEHDLRRSVITIAGTGCEGKLSVEVRAHKELDVFRIDVVDRRQETPVLHLHLQKDHAFEDRVENDTYLSWHVNRSSVYRSVNEQSGVDLAGVAQDILLGRCFGTAMAIDVQDGKAQWTSGFCETSGTGRLTLWIAAGANIKGFDAWRKDVLDRLAQARAMGDSFITSHEAWWHEFWRHSYLEFPGDDGTCLRHQAAFDLYRYYLACSADRRRELPVRFLNDVLRYNEQQFTWLTMDITSIETYQVLYGAMRTGDWSALASRLEFYVRALPVFHLHSRQRFPHNGSVAPYETNPWGTWLHWRGTVDYYTEERSPYLRYSWQGNLWMLALFCDYALLCDDGLLIDEGLQAYATEVLIFFREHYPQRRDGRIDFTPSEAGETFSGVTNSAELIVALKCLLPRLLELGKARGWSHITLAQWQQMLRALPELPRGSLRYEPQSTRPILETSDLLAPAASLENIDPPNPINHQHTELFAIWPGKLVLRDAREHDLAVKSYHARQNQHWTSGWCLDVSFAACLGLLEDVSRWWRFHFDTTFSFPCGLAQEASPKQGDRESITLSPSMQGLGTGVIPVLEMLLTDYSDLIVILPCWDPKVAVRFSLFSPYAGKVTVDYDPARGAAVHTERPIRLEFGAGIQAAKR